jgi:hypothetical protein
MDMPLGAAMFSRKVLSLRAARTPQWSMVQQGLRYRSAAVRGRGRRPLQALHACVTIDADAVDSRVVALDSAPLLTYVAPATVT